MAQGAHAIAERRTTDDGWRTTDGRCLTADVGYPSRLATKNTKGHENDLGVITKDTKARSHFRFQVSSFRFLLSLLTVCLATAATAAPKAPLSTGRVMNPGDVLHEAPGALLGDKVYAEVNSASLPKLYDEFRSELFKRGILKRDDRYTCKHFAALFAELAQTRYFEESYRSTGPARALAIGSIWYVRDDGRGPHAIVQILSERGRIYLEPQTGREIALSPKEEASAYFRFF